ncbi:MAG TPA: antibiotic biosynthesis monooxygenase [Acidobacteriota bacterium]
MMLTKTSAFCLLLVTNFCVPLFAVDPVQVYPNNYKVLLENDQVRVLDFILRKGDTEDFHSHPAHVLYVLAPLKIKFSFPDGRLGMREAKPGDVLFSEAVTHSPVNIGDNDAHGILVELKTPNAAKAMPSTEDFLTAVTFIRGMEGKELEVKSELLSLSKPTRAEPGCLQYDLYQSPTKPNEFMRLEMWRTPADLEAHKLTPHLKASFERRKNQGWMTDITVWNRVKEDIR